MLEGPARPRNPSPGRLVGLIALTAVAMTAFSTRHRAGDGPARGGRTAPPAPAAPEPVPGAAAAASAPQPPSIPFFDAVLTETLPPRRRPPRPW